MTSFSIGDVVDIPWRPERPTITITSNDYENVIRLRPALIVAAKRRSTLTYSEVATAIDNQHFAQGLKQTGRLLDLLSADCHARGEPSLAALVVRANTGEVGDSFVGDAGVGREECYKYWSAG